MDKAIGSILLVEDNAQDAEITIRILKNRGGANEVHWVKDGVEALDFIHTRAKYADRNPHHLPQLVLMDLRLPKVGGFELLKDLRSDPRYRLLPIVVLTSSTEEEDIVRSYELGANSFVSKPVKFEEFCALLEQVGMYWLRINRRPDRSQASRKPT